MEKSMSRKQKYIVKLSKKDREQLEKMTSKGRHSSRELNRARILLYRDTSKNRVAKNQSWIVEMLGISRNTVIRTCQRYCEAGLSKALYEEYRSGRPHVLQNEDKAKLVALACSKSPEGRERWTHRLLAQHYVQMEFTDSVSPTTVGRVLKKTNLNLGKEDNGALEK